MRLYNRVAAALVEFEVSSMLNYVLRHHEWKAHCLSVTQPHSPQHETTRRCYSCREG